jgi:hypothetical protein
MIRITDQVVADWGIFVWEQDGEFFEQVQALLFNGMVLIVDIDDFFSISDDDGW